MMTREASRAGTRSPAGRLVGLLVSLAVSLVVLPAVPAHGYSTYLCTGYVSCQDKGYSHAGYRTAGQQMWWRMYAGHNCTNYVAYRLVQNGMSPERPWSGSGNATNSSRLCTLAEAWTRNSVSATVIVPAGTVRLLAANARPTVPTSSERAAARR